ncbi:MAG: hypothetical protein NTY50_01035 [Methylobacter sp.]|nr:hypothetical protein [Methylobacter sp.]
MKNLILTVAVGISSSVFLSGCGKSAVACDDNDAKILVMQISEQEIKNILLKMINPFSTYAEYAELAERGGRQEQEQIDNVNKQYADADPVLSNIRTESLDDKLLKTECAADIKYENGKKTSINYELSVTSEGELYAEVSGLR